MLNSALVRLVGFPATLIHGDTAVVDRWMWLRKRLPLTRSGERLLDVGCGSGAFTIGSSLRGYIATGLSWDARNQKIAQERAEICRAKSAHFEIQDVRELASRIDLRDCFDVVICMENIEHIIDDRTLMRAIYSCLKPGGRLLLSTPYLLYVPMSAEDMGPFSVVEDGWHVRRGYNASMLRELCVESGFYVEQLSGCTGILSHRLTSVLRALTRVNRYLAWAVILPFRLLPPLLDRALTPALNWPYYSICVEAYKPRFGQAKSDGKSA